MTIDPSVFGLAGLAIACSVIAGALIGLHVKNRVAGLDLRDNLRAMIYLTRFDAALEYHGLRRRELRARVDELRSNLAESAADGGVAAAIHRLGPPRVLAAEVAGSRMVPSWSRGTLWVAAAVAIGMFAFAMSMSAFLAAVDSAGAPGATATWSPFFLRMTGTSTSTGGGSATFTLELSPVWLLLLLLVPFALGSRVWRLWTGDRTRQPSGQPQ